MFKPGDTTASTFEEKGQNPKQTDNFPQHVKHSAPNGGSQNQRGHWKLNRNATVQINTLLVGLPNYKWQNTGEETESRCYRENLKSIDVPSQEPTPTPSFFLVLPSRFCQ